MYCTEPVTSQVTCVGCHIITAHDTVLKSTLTIVTQRTQRFLIQNMKHTAQKYY